MQKSTKFLLLTGIAAITLSGIFGWNYFASQSYAAGDHGDGHAHEEAEEKHDTAKEEHGHGHESASNEEEGEHNEGSITLSPEQIATAGITVTTAGPGSLAREVIVPGKIVAAADRMAQIVPKANGVVTEARKNLGDNVAKGETLALVESREMAEAVAEYQASQRAEELTRTTFERERQLWEKKITSEQDYLNAKNAHQEAGIRLDLAKQKLRALGHEGNIDPKINTRFHQLKSPISGRVIARELTLGEYVDSTHSAFTIADLSIVWVETAIAPTDLAFVKEGQEAVITGSGGKAPGKLIFVSPAVDSETRTVKAIIEVDNADGLWRPGEFTNAAIATSVQDSDLVVPKEAIQTIEGRATVFVRSTQGFEKRDVTTGREDAQNVEILSGLNVGESVAITNTFSLKAELGKAEAEHEH